MQCKHIQRQLSDYVDGVLSEEVSRQIKQHLAYCHACAREYHALRRTVEIVQSEMPEVWVSSERLETLEAQLWGRLDRQRQPASHRWWQAGKVAIQWRWQILRTTWTDALDIRGWGRRLQVVVSVLLIMFAGIWVDRQYFRPTFPEMIRKALVDQTTFTPASMFEATVSRAANQRVSDSTNPRVNELANQTRFENSLVPLPSHPPIQSPAVDDVEGLEVRAVGFKDGKLLFVGTLDVLGATEVQSEEPALRELDMPTDNPTVVMLPRRFDEPTAPSRIRKAQVFEDLLEQLAYPVASPTALIIGERGNPQ